MRIVFYIFLMLPVQTIGQSLTDESRVTVSAPGGDEVTLYSADECDHCYYYLPSSLRIATGQGTPEISFVMWKDEETERPTGGIFHFLVEWGMRPGYERDVQKVLRATHDSLAVIMGPAMVYAQDSGGMIDGKDKLAEILTTSLKNIPSAPSTPGAKMAMSFRFTETEIADFLYYVEHPGRTKANLKIAYSYSVSVASGQERVKSITVRLPLRHILETIK